MFKKTFHLVSKYQLYIIVGLNVVIFALLLFKNPFSDRTLIPNFEPYPDTIHYVNPARSFIVGKGLKITREYGQINPGVPPLYSIILIPFFLIYNDARVFYFANIFLALISFIFFFKILKKITNNLWVINLVLFLYVSNYFLYWYPTLAMAENLVIPLFLVAVYLLLLPVTLINSFIAGVLVVSFYATKYACAPLAVSYFLLYLIKIIIDNKNKRVTKFKDIVFLYVGMFLALGLFLNVSSVIRSIVELVPQLLVRPFLQWLPTNKRPDIVAAFSQSNQKQFLIGYLLAILGNRARFLWDYTPIIPNYIAVLSILGILLSFLNKRLRFLGLSLMLMLIFSIYFMSNFYTFDMRYIIQAIPILLLGCALVLTLSELFLIKIKLRRLFHIFLLALFLFYLLPNVIRFKKQIMLNLKYRETPWYYIAVLKLNEYFTKPSFAKASAGKKKPIVISALIAYFIDFHSNGNYDLLPLSADQDFRKKRQLIWGQNDYSDLIKLYKQYLKKGYQLYVHNSGLGNVDYLHSAFGEIEKNFILTKVSEGCYNTCNIYKVELKDASD